MNRTESNAAILAALRAALAAKITASIGLDVIDNDEAPDGYTMTITVTVDGFGAHFGDDMAAAAEGLSRRVDEAIADRAKLG
jgi:hypothetical protein